MLHLSFVFFVLFVVKCFSMSPENNYLAQYESSLTLKDGKEVFVRPIRTTDGDLLVDLFNRISPQSVYLRFLGHLHALPEELLHHFTHVDYESEFALVALAEEDEKDAIIAVARYAHNPGENITDLAIAVRDDWQRLGLGRAMLDRIIIIAKEHGIRRFVSMMDPRNSFIGQTLQRLGYTVKFDLKGAYYQVDILL
jgi:GNAT superfamily N-acetyltransferase